MNREILLRNLRSDATGAWGDGWEHLSPRQRQAELALAALERMNAAMRRETSAVMRRATPDELVERLRIYADYVLDNGQEEVTA